MNTKYFENLRWTPSGIFIVVFHAVLLIGLPVYFYFTPPRLGMIISSSLLLYLTAIGISAGYHRFYAHCAYQLKKPVEAVFLFFATLALQGSALRWSYDHRLHHVYVDKPGDPYNVKKGFWYAHVLWLFEDQPAIEEKVVPDLFKNKLVMFQNRHYLFLGTVSNTAVCFLIGWMGHDFLGAFALGWGVRLLVTYHLTWFINSLAHYWGEQSYSKELSARDNAILALLTVGEGYHNYHHTFPADYRNGSRLYHFDPVKWTVWSLSRLGLASQLKRFHKEYIMDKLIGLDTSLLLKRVSEFKQVRYMSEKVSIFEATITRLAESLRTKRREMSTLIIEYRAIRRDKKDKNIRRSLKVRLKENRLHYRAEWKRWCDLCKVILNSKMTM